jgi:hypothetical protein
VQDEMSVDAMHVFIDEHGESQMSQLASKKGTRMAGGFLRVPCDGSLSTRCCSGQIVL